MKKHKYRHPNSLRKKKPMRAPFYCCWKMHATPFGNTEAPFTGVNSEMYENLLKDKSEGSSNVETTNLSYSLGREVKLILLQNDDARPHPNTIHLAAIRNVGNDVIPHLPFKARSDTI